MLIFYLIACIFIFEYSKVLIKLLLNKYPIKYLFFYKLDRQLSKCNFKINFISLCVLGILVNTFSIIFAFSNKFSYSYVLLISNIVVINQIRKVNL